MTAKAKPAGKKAARKKARKEAAAKKPAAPRKLVDLRLPPGAALPASLFPLWLGTTKQLKPKPGQKLPSLTTAQIKKLADALRDRQSNVYDLIRRTIGPTLEADGPDRGDTLFARLKAEGKVFKCENCDTWLGIALRDPAFEETDICAECVNRMNEPSDDEDEDEDEE